MDLEFCIVCLWLVAIFYKTCTEQCCWCVF